MRKGHCYKCSNMERVIRGYNEQLYASKFGKMDKFLEKYIYPIINQKENLKT